MIFDIIFPQLKEEQSVHGSDEEVEDDPPEPDTDFSDDDNKRDHEEVNTFLMIISSWIPRGSVSMS